MRRLYTSDESEMVVVYGRRRVGKTFLVNRVFGEDEISFKLTGIYRGKLKLQLQNFDIALKDYFPDVKVNRSTSWMDAFATLRQCLRSLKRNGKHVLFFDEMPWMDTRGSNFLSALEWFWNGWANAQTNIMLIACGSATNWIINKLFKHKGGLYNRATSRIFLQPFTLAETEQYLQKSGFNLERYDIAQIYMIMGGIPYYLKQLEPNRPVMDNIDNCFFKRHGKLWDEFDNLYETLFSNSDLYLKIVQTLAGKPYGLTREDLITQMKLSDNGRLSQALRDLEKCGFIGAYRFFGRKTKSLIYQLTDFYTMFYFRFIKDNYADDEHFWTHALDNPRRLQWLGYSFEQLIKSHIGQVKQALGIASVLSEHSCWHIEAKKTPANEVSRGAQIDLLIDRRDRAINICEAKFYSGKFSIQKDYAESLRNKIVAFREATGTRKTLVPTMITTFGVVQNKYSNLIQQEVTLDDLFAQLR